VSSGKLAAALVPASVAVAAALLGLRLRLQPPTVPLYTLAGTSGGTALAPGDRFELVLKPTAPIQGAVGARGFLLRPNEVRPWDPPFAVGVDGSVHLEGDVAAVFAGVPSGEWDVAVAVGRPELLPTAPRDILRALEPRGGPAGWRLLHERVRLGG
jgi:hypothetical protein